MDNVVPRAFLSCAEEDEEFGKFLAEQLLANGVEAWLYVWDVAYGESIRQRVEDGMTNADFVIPIITPYSLESDWCKLETDAAFVLKLRGSAKIFPVVKDIEIQNIPLFQQTIRVINYQDHDDTAQKLINACLGLSDKPQLIARTPPSSMANEGLSINASRIAFLFAEQSETGCEAFIDPFLDVEELSVALNLQLEEIEDAIDELVEIGFVVTHPAINTPLRISPTDRLFWYTDPYVKDWSPSEDAVKVAALTINLGEAVGMSDVAGRLGYDPRRINPAVTFLTAHNFIDTDQALGSHPYMYWTLYRTAATRRFVNRHQ